nr:hypothetical protein [uncultured Arsenicibacter sp.]
MTTADSNFDDTMKGLATILLAANDFSVILTVLGAIFALLSIVKLILDIRYHPLNRKKDDGTTNDRTDSNGSPEEL